MSLLQPCSEFSSQCCSVCLCRLYRRCLCPDEVRQQTLQHRQTPRQNQSLRGTHTGAAVCRRCCFNIPQQGGPPTSRRQAVPRLQGVWANDQHQVDPHPGARCWVPSPPQSPTWTPPCQAQLRSMLKSAAGSLKQLLSWPNSTSECGAMTCWKKERTKICTYQACVLSTLLYGSKSWTTYARQERRLNWFHLRCLRRLLHIRWQDRVTNTEVLEHAGSLSMPSLFIQRHLRWLSHTHRMEPDRLPRETLYGELREGVRCVGWLLLHHKGVIKWHLQSALIDTSAWDDIAKHWDTWRQSVKARVSKAEANARVQATCKRAVRKERAAAQFHKARLRHVQQRLPLQDRATHSYKVLPKSPVLTIASSRWGCHYYIIYYIYLYIMYYTY